MTGDEVRLLARQSERGYVEHSARAMDYREPEAVSEDAQREISAVSRVKAAGARRDEIEALLKEARGELEHLQAVTRGAERKVARMETRLRRAGGRPR